MSRRKKELDLNGKKIIIEELRIIDLMELLNVDGGFMLSDFKKIFYDFLPKFTNLTLEDILPLGMSELTELVETFKMVNSDFFNALKSLGILDYLNGLLKELKNSTLSDLSAMYADSSKKDT